MTDFLENVRDYVSLRTGLLIGTTLVILLVLGPLGLLPLKFTMKLLMIGYVAAIIVGVRFYEEMFVYRIFLGIFKWVYLLYFFMLTFIFLLATGTMLIANDLDAKILLQFIAVVAHIFFIFSAKAELDELMD